MNRPSVMAALGLLRFATACVVATSVGCAFRTADLPVVADRPATHDRIYVVVDSGRSYPGAAEAHWRLAAELAADLEEAGFVPTLVRDRGSAPFDAALIEDIDPGGECFAEPMLTVLTVGIIPHVGCQEFGHRFTLRPPDSSDARSVDAHFTVRALWGWLTWPAVLLPGWSYDLSPEISHEREIQVLRAAVRDAVE